MEGKGRETIGVEGKGRETIGVKGKGNTTFMKSFGLIY